MSAPLLVSAANFVAEPRDLFETRLPRHLRGHCPHVFPLPGGGEGWSWASEPPRAAFGWDFRRGDATPRWTYAELPAAAVDPATHLAAMNDARIGAAVLFPLALLEGCRRLGPEMRRSCIAAYNDWVTETFEAQDPTRLLAPRVLPPLSAPSLAAAELERALSSSARAVLLPSLDTLALSDEEEMIWNELAEAGITVCLPAPRRPPGTMADTTQTGLIERILTKHHTLRIVVVPVDTYLELAGESRRSWDLPPARLFDAEAHRGIDLYCADLPRQLVELPDRASASPHAQRAFRFALSAQTRHEPRLSLRLRLPIVHATQAEPAATLPRVGLALANLVDEKPMTARTLAISARRIEEMGFHGIWVGDVVARRAGMHALDPFTALGIAAAVTDEVELGTCILQVPLRGRVELAHRALSMHQLVPGRFMFGVGAGSTQADFDAAGLSFVHRFREMREALPDMKALWRGDQVGSARLYPTAGAIGGPPVLIGSWGGSWVERAAREYDGWIASGTRTWRTLGEAVARFHAAGGERAVVSSVFADFSYEDGPLEDEDRVHLACSPREGVARLQRLAAVGFTDVVVFNQGPLEPLSEFTALVKNGQ